MWARHCPRQAGSRALPRNPGAFMPELLRWVPGLPIGLCPPALVIYSISNFQRVFPANFP